MNVYENERIDAVNDSLSLIQKTDGLTFGTDALLLAGYVSAGYKTGIELGTGSGIISMLILSRKKCSDIYAVEVQEEYTRLTERNAEMNALSSHLYVKCADVRDYRHGSEVDLVFTNPPYMKSSSGKTNLTDAKNIARHEVMGTICDFIRCAAKSLKHGGDFYCVYRPDRMIDLLYAMRENKIEPKLITMVHANRNSEPSMMLVMGKKCANASLKFTKPLIIYRDGYNSEYTDEMNYIMENGCFPPEFTKRNAR